MAHPVEPVTASDAFAVTKSDTTVFQRIPSALYVGAEGDVQVVTEMGSTVLFLAVPAGTTIPLRIKQVMSTNTGASSMVALVY